MTGKRPTTRFEAELYFAKGNSLAGLASLREGPCDGYVKANVVYDPLETAEGRQAVRKTRRLTGGEEAPSRRSWMGLVLRRVRVGSGWAIPHDAPTA